MGTATAQPPASGPRSSQRNSGTPRSRSTESAFGRVQTRSGSASRSSGDEPATDGDPAGGTDAGADGPFDDVTFPPARCTPPPRLVSRAAEPGRGAPEAPARSGPLQGVPEPARGPRLGSTCPFRPPPGRPRACEGTQARKHLPVTAPSRASPSLRGDPGGGP